MLNGSGIRVVLWVAGCEHYCKNCQNQLTWDVHGGIPFDKNAYDEICEDLKQDYCSGLTLSGGDPMHKDNRGMIFRLCQNIKTQFPNKTIWMYTGYLFDEDLLNPNGKVHCEVTKEILDGIKNQGYVLKFVAESRLDNGNVKIAVEPVLVTNKNPLSGVSYEFNALFCKFVNFFFNNFFR